MSGSGILDQMLIHIKNSFLFVTPCKLNFESSFCQMADNQVAAKFYLVE